MRFIVTLLMLLVCGAGEGLDEYVPECDDLSGQDRVSGGFDQR